jgi:septum formation protein
MSDPIVLASTSPRRKQLLEMLRIPFRAVAPDVDETRHPGEAPEPYVRRVAHAKAQNVAGRERRALVLGADTTVVLDGELFAKPVDAAVAVAGDGRLEEALDVSAVTFRPAAVKDLERYVATGEPLDKAGAYAIQGLGAPLVERVDGDFFGVMGLPLRLVLDLLARFGRDYRFTR